MHGVPASRSRVIASRASQVSWVATATQVTLRDSLARSRPVHFYSRMGGMLVSPDEVVDKVKAVLDGSSEEVHHG